MAKGYTAKLRRYASSGGYADLPFASQAEFVDVLVGLRKGECSILGETPADARRRAEEHVQSLRVGGVYRLMPGANAWDLVLVNDDTGEVTVLCGRAGPHTQRFAQAIVGVTRDAPPSGQTLQTAQTKAEKKAEVRQLNERSSTAKAALRKAAALAHADNAAELVKLVAKRGQRLESDLVASNRGAGVATGRGRAGREG